MKYFLQNKAASILNMSRYTLADLEKDGKVEPAKRLSNGYRYYFKDDIIKIAKLYYKEGWDKIIEMSELEN